MPPSGDERVVQRPLTGNERGTVCPTSPLVQTVPPIETYHIHVHAHALAEACARLAAIAPHITGARMPAVAGGRTAVLPAALRAALYIYLVLAVPSAV